MKYLIIYTDSLATSFCNFNTCKGLSHLIGLENLKEGILWALKENLRIHVVYPEHKIPEEFEKIINSVDHLKIKPISSEGEMDICVINSWDELTDNAGFHAENYIVRTALSDFIKEYQKLIPLFQKAQRLNIVFTDYSNISKRDLELYKEALFSLANHVADLWPCGQLNILSDRMMLSQMNNCGAGVEVIALMPDGLFYTCPGEYFDALNSKSPEEVRCSCGSPKEGIKIINSQLYKIEYAPLCRICDAYNCQRCTYMNKQRTLEVNTPSRIQCVMAHISRNASRLLGQLLRDKGIIIGNDVPEISYLDPLEIHPRYRMK